MKKALVTGLSKRHRRSIVVISHMSICAATMIFASLKLPKELHSPSFTLLFCLAASDLLVGIIAPPCFVAYNVAKILDHFSAYCKLRMIQFFCGWITYGVSLLTLSGVCIDRLLALTLHLRYSSLISVTGGNGYSRSLGHLFCWDHHKVLVRQMGHSSRNRSSVDPSNDCVLHK